MLGALTPLTLALLGVLRLVINVLACCLRLLSYSRRALTVNFEWSLEADAHGSNDG
jgi:hypothetical protein